MRKTLTDTQKKIMQLGVFKTQTDVMMYLIAHSMSRKNEPVGSWSLKLDFDEHGIDSSTATIGRYLKMMDAKGYTVQRSNRGRILTPAGKIWLDGLERRINRAQVRDDVSRRMHVNEYAEMVDLMRVRKLIEVEAACLAAQNANDEDIKPLIDGDANFAFGSGESFESAGFKEGTAEELENDDIFGDFEASEEPDDLL